MHIRVLTRTDVSAFQQLRRERLELEPRAFAESLTEHDSTTTEAIAKRLESSSLDNFVIGAFAPGGQMVGMMGFARNLREKSRHKGLIWGVFVQPAWRNQGVSLRAIVERVEKQHGVAISTDAIRRLSDDVPGAVKVAQRGRRLKTRNGETGR